MSIHGPKRSVRRRQGGRIRREYLGIALAVAAGATACGADVDRAIQPTAPTVDVPVVNTPPSALVEPAPQHRFGVTLTASGAFRPGEPIQFHAVAEALLDTRSAELTITFPEIDVARLDNWRGAPARSVMRSIPMRAPPAG